MHKNNKKTTAYGFTLVEMAIVIVIVGVIIGAVLKGQQYIVNARIAKTVAEITGYKASTAQFQEKYGQLPGDLSTATKRLPDCGPQTYCRDGDSDTYIGIYRSVGIGTMLIDQSQGGPGQEYETVQFWRHLLLSDLIHTVRVVDQSDPQNIAWGATHPPSALGLGGYHVHFAHGIVAGAPLAFSINANASHYLRLQNPVTGVPVGAGNENVVPVAVSVGIDLKLDNGDLATGAVVAGGPTCVITGGGGGCSLKSKQNNCVMWFDIGL